MKVCGGGLLLPGTAGIASWPTAVTACLSGASLLYSFMGVAVVADVFMASIEEVTSQKVTRVLPGGRRQTRRRWNMTVATLTLMALGSSAPEIFLSVIDIMKKNFYFGELGPSTIVGSAAFNLLMIVAVCIVVIPKDEVRIIKNLPAFYITALFSMFAYLWMALILLYSSPGIVEFWEALVTLLLMLPLVYLSYKVDRGDVDGLLRMLRIVSAEDEAIAAKPRGANVDWRRKPVCLTSSTLEDKDEYTVVWHNRNDGWQAQTFEGFEEAEKRYKQLPVSATRALLDADGCAAKSWYLSRKWGGHLRTFYSSLKGGTYLKFPSETLEVDASAEDFLVEVVINRTGDAGMDTELSCAFRTESMTAVAGYDYEAIEGMLEFEPGVKQKILTLNIHGKAAWRRECLFLVILDDAHGDLTFDPTDDGGSSRAILTVKLKPSAEYEGNRSVKKYVDSAVCIYRIMFGFEDWKEQLTSWVFVNGSREEQSEASRSDWFFHILGLPWKLMSAIMPPTAFLGGWLAFYCSLFMIGLLTALVSDLAELLGCVVRVPDIVTAISFVALGTSMPDLFASLTAAKEDDTADASVVNVTGSNSVNVFLGLGAPWSIAALYWQISGRSEEWASRYPEEAAMLPSGAAAFVVRAHNLGYSVLIFCVTCVFAIVVLHLRRKWLGAELGGPLAPKYATAITFALYWCLFVAMVSWRVLRWDISQQPSGLWLEGILVHGLGGFAFLVFTGVTLYLTWANRKLESTRSGSVGKRESKESFKSRDSKESCNLPEEDTEDCCHEAHQPLEIRAHKGVRQHSNPSFKTSDV